MDRTTVERLHDALRACDEIVSLLDGMSEPEFLASRTHRYSVNWQFVVLGESLNVAVNEQDVLASMIPDARNAIAMRHRIPHGYQSIDYKLMWQIASVQVPRIREQISRVLENIG